MQGEPFGGGVPRLATGNPFVEAECDPDTVAGPLTTYGLLVAAAGRNEARVRELIGLVLRARQSLERDEPALAAHQLEAIEFGLGALLPPVNIRISTRLIDAISKSG
jgi:hypothetical protein